MTASTSPFVKDVTASFGHVWRGVQVQRNSEVAAFICHAVKAKLVGHVCHLVLLILLPGYHLHWSLFPSRIRKTKSGFGQVPPQDLHEAMSIAVIMDGTTLSW
jgi:hypothetical protein